MTVITDNARNLLRLAELPGVGTVSIRRIVEIARLTGSLMTYDEAREQVLVKGKPEKAASNLSESIIAKCLDGDIGIVSVLDDEYPHPLRKIDDYPPVLYFKGSLSNLGMIGAAVVGTREASKVGLSWARQISEVLVGYDFSVVSGLALGIDTAAHEGALRADGKTIAILAHGLHQVTPASNKDLASRILDNDGTLVSEHPPGVPPRRAEYVRRNRIQSGMSVCSIVVESGDVGGAIHQGNFTTRQGRRLFCIVPSSDVPGASEFKYGGALRLTQEAGARAIASRADLTELLNSGELQNDFNQLFLGMEYRTAFL
jgi:DNA processing protein